MSNTAQNYARIFAMHRGALISLLETIPHEKASFQAWEGGMNFHRLSDHLSGSGERIGAMLAGQTPTKPEPTADWSSAIERLRTNTQTLQSAIGAMSDEQLSTVIEAFGGQKMPVSSLIDFAIQHEAHHKGQVWMMSRMIGLEPPMFVKLG
jgi:uncharacterized damage-inducible protein DinB